MVHIRAPLEVETPAVALRIRLYLLGIRAFRCLDLLAVSALLREQQGVHDHMKYSCVAYMAE